jgi:hypothetical protein
MPRIGGPLIALPLTLLKVFSVVLPVKSSALNFAFGVNKKVSWVTCCLSTAQEQAAWGSHQSLQGSVCGPVEFLLSLLPEPCGNTCYLVGQFTSSAGGTIDDPFTFI